MKIFSRLITFVVIIAILGFAAFKFGLIDIRQFPKPEGLKTVTLNCNYHGQKLAIQENLYDSIDNYYKSNPKKRFMSYESYVSEAKEDKTLEDLTGKIEVKGRSLGLNPDQTADLSTCFVQNIPYDSAKAKVVLSNSPSDKLTKITNNYYFDRFPYETLYDNEGICTDKSYLEAALLKQMGYGTALLTFDIEHHMAVGIEVPNGYSSFNTGYSYIETTNTGYKVGQLPIINTDNGGASQLGLNKLSGGINSGNIIPELPQSNFSPPTQVIKVADGKDYNRIIEITNKNNKIQEVSGEINSLSKEIASYKHQVQNSEGQAVSAKNQLNTAETKLNEAKNIYEQDSSEQNYQAYQQAYNEYQNTYAETKGVIDNYDSAVSVYNAKVDELNRLIDEYNSLVQSD